MYICIYVMTRRTEDAAHLSRVRSAIWYDISNMEKTTQEK